MKGDLVNGLDSIEVILDNCLDQMLLEGKIESHIDLSPEQKNEIDPLLNLASRLNSGKALKPSPDFQNSSRLRLINKIGANSSRVNVGLDRNNIQVYSMKGRFTRSSKISLRFAIGTLVIVLALFVLTGMGLAASENSIPGNFLYPVKIAIEETRLQLTIDQTQALYLRLEFAANRLVEAKLLAKSRDFNHLASCINQYTESTFEIMSRLSSHKDGSQNTHLDTFRSLLYDRLEQDHVLLTELFSQVPDNVKVYIKKALEFTENSQDNVNEVNINQFQNQINLPIEPDGIDLINLPSGEEETNLSPTYSVTVMPRIKSTNPIKNIINSAWAWFENIEFPSFSSYSSTPFPPSTVTPGAIQTLRATSSINPQDRSLSERTRRPTSIPENRPQNPRRTPILTPTPIR
jgi:hypothetical protein